jgi:hypothetical protein
LCDRYRSRPPAPRRADPDLKWACDPVRVQSASHDLTTIIGGQGQTAAIVPKVGAGTAGWKQKGHYGPSHALVIRVLHANYRFFGARRADVVDCAVTFQDDQMKGTVLSG